MSKNIGIDLQLLYIEVQIKTKNVYKTNVRLKKNKLI